MIETDLKIKRGSLAHIYNYIEVLKPRETILLTFIGVSSAIIASNRTFPAYSFVLVSIAILLGSAGCNGLTNYLDRELDARMKRTQQRSLPQRRVFPAEKVLPLTIGLILVGLVLAWLAHPYCFIAGLVGTIAAIVGRKTGFTHLLGGISGSAPVIIGWLAIDPHFGWTIFWLSILIAIWVPVHVWSVMVANKDDYWQAGVHIFPITWSLKTSITTVLLLSILLVPISILIYLTSSFGLIYLITAIVLGTIMIGASFRLLFSGISRDAWRVYKLSAFPYLGILFLAMIIDTWL